MLKELGGLFVIRGSHRLELMLVSVNDSKGFSEVISSGQEKTTMDIEYIGKQRIQQRHQLHYLLERPLFDSLNQQEIKDFLLVQGFLQELSMEVVFSELESQLSGLVILFENVEQDFDPEFLLIREEGSQELEDRLEIEVEVFVVVVLAPTGELEFIYVEKQIIKKLELLTPLIRPFLFIADMRVHVCSL